MPRNTVIVRHADLGTEKRVPDSPGTLKVLARSGWHPVKPAAKTAAKPKTD